MWGTGYLEQAKAKALPVHMRHLGFLKRLLGVKRSTCTDAVLRETGQLPLEFYWFRAVIKFWNAVHKESSRRAGAGRSREGVNKIDLKISLPVLFAYTHGVHGGWPGKVRAQQGPRGDDVIM